MNSKTWIVKIWYASLRINQSSKVYLSLRYLISNKTQSVWKDSQLAQCQSISRVRPIHPSETRFDSSLTRITLRKWNHSDVGLILSSICEQEFMKQRQNGSHVFQTKNVESRKIRVSWTDATAEEYFLNHHIIIFLFFFFLNTYSLPNHVTPRIIIGLLLGMVWIYTLNKGKANWLKSSETNVIQGLLWTSLLF
jgi:hypothetical protein